MNTIISTNRGMYIIHSDIGVEKFVFRLINLVEQKYQVFRLEPPIVAIRDILFSWK